MTLGPYSILTENEVNRPNTRKENNRKLWMLHEKLTLKIEI